MSKKLTYEYIKEYIENEGEILCSNEYYGANKKLLLICKNGHEYEIKWNYFQQGNRCSICQHYSKKHEYEYIKKYIENEGEILKSKEYNGNKRKLLLTCKNGHDYRISFNKFQQGKRCFICYNEGKNDFNIVKEEFEKENYEVLSKEYKNSYNKLDVICSNGHKIKISYKKFLYGNRCNICNIENRTGNLHWNWKGGISCEPYCEQWKDKEYKESIKERDGYMCLNPYCKGNYKRLNIHHIDYNKKNCHPLNLITLCASCNSKANKYREWHKEWYNIIINKRYLREEING